MNAPDKEKKYSIDLGSFVPVDVDQAWNQVSENIKGRPASRRKTLRRRIIISATGVAAVVACLFLIFDFGRDAAQDQYVDMPVILRPGHTGVVYVSDGIESPISREHTVITSQGEVVDKAGNDNLGLSLSADRNTIIVPRGVMHNVTLPDGTDVILNADTKLSFPAAFSAEVREVQLEGEAYFRVHKSDVPFIVTYGDNSTQVLGTEFNINCYPGSEQLLTTLVSGSIRVSAPDEEIILQPSQQFVYSPQAGRGDVRVVDTRTVTSWVSGRFEFINMPLDEVVTQIERWYNIDIVFAADDIRKIVFTGAAYRNGNANELFDIIERISNVKFNYTPQGVIVIDRQ